MSALGLKRTCAVQKGMSAFPPIATTKADIRLVDQRGQATQGTVERCAAIQASWRRLSEQ
jgi:hypothetical protein